MVKMMKRVETSIPHGENVFHQINESSSSKDAEKWIE